MDNRIIQALLAGLAGTGLMSAFMMIGGMMGMPEMSPPDMLATTMGTSVAVGWIMHFMIGIVFALLYVYLFRGMLASIASVWMKGLAFGVIAFVLAQIGMMVMGAMFPAMPEMSGNMVMIVIASLLGHIVFGVVVALVATSREAAEVAE